MLRRRGWLGWVALASVGCGSASPPAGDALPVVLSSADIEVVRSESVATGPRLAGTLEPADRAVIRAEASGAVVAVDAELGDPVEIGQVLGRIAPSGTGEQRRSARASAISAAQSLTVAKRDLERTERLASAGALSPRDLELARGQVAAAEAQLAGARAQQAASDVQVGRTTLTSPIAGVVSERSVSVGDVVTMGASMFTILDPSSLRLEGAVPPSSLVELRVGDAVRFEVQGYAERAFLGAVDRISPAVDPVSRQVPVLVSVPNEAGILVAGLFADGRVATQEHQGLVVAADAVDRNGPTPFVLRVDGGHVRQVDVTVGLVDEARGTVELTSGVVEGDRLVVAIARTMAPDAAVVVEDAPTSSRGAARPNEEG